MNARRQAAGTLAASVTAGSLAWLVGVTVIGSAMIALLVAALVPVLFNPVDEAKSLPPVRPGVRHGARVEVSRLSWAIAGRRGYLDPRVVRRLRTTARRRLADLRLDPAHPDQAARAESALGSWAYRVVIDGRTELTRREVVRLVEAIEGLGSRRECTNE